MDTGERLAAYLAGELADDQRAALEEDLARDPALRARLERIRALDAELGRLPPVSPPPGFGSRLRRAVAEELDRTPLVADEVIDLADRRERRVRLLRRLGVAAAAATVIGVAAVGIGDLLATSDETTDASPAPAAREPGNAPLVAVTGRDYSATEVEALPGSAPLRALAPGELSEEQARELQAARTEALLGELTGTTASADEGGRTAGDVSRPEASPLDGGPASATLYQGVPDEAVRDVRACLRPLLDSADEPVIPVRAEVARFEGEPAVLYVLASRDPASGAFDRLEVWVTARSDCQVLLFAQASG